MLIYVDDIIVIRSNLGMISSLIHLLRKEFSLNDLGKFHYFSSIEVIYQNNGSFANQTRYAITLLDSENITDYKPISTPL